MTAFRRTLKWAVAAGVFGVAALGLAFRGARPGGRVREWLMEHHNARRIEGFAREAGRIPEGSVVFLGSSTISGFPFARLFPAAPCVNRGVGGDTTSGLLRRLDPSLPVARPSGVVVYSGANDLRVERQDPAEIVATTGLLLDALGARWPGVPVTIVETLPMSDPPPGDPARLRALNDGARALAEARGAVFLRTNRPPLADAEGRLSKDFTRDGEHLDAAGYEVLARWLAEEGGPATAALRGR